MRTDGPLPTTKLTGNCQLLSTPQFIVRWYLTVVRLCTSDSDSIDTQIYVISHVRREAIGNHSSGQLCMIYSCGIRMTNMFCWAPRYFPLCTKTSGPCIDVPTTSGVPALEPNPLFVDR